MSRSRTKSMYQGFNSLKWDDEPNNSLRAQGTKSFVPDFSGWENEIFKKSTVEQSPVGLDESAELMNIEGFLLSENKQQVLQKGANYERNDPYLEETLDPDYNALVILLKKAAHVRKYETEKDVKNLPIMRNVTLSDLRIKKILSRTAFARAAVFTSPPPAGGAQGQVTNYIVETMRFPASLTTGTYEEYSATYDRFVTRAEMYGQILQFDEQDLGPRLVAAALVGEGNGRKVITVSESGYCTLSEVLAARKSLGLPFTEDEALCYLRQMLKALETLKFFDIHAIESVDTHDISLDETLTNFRLIISENTLLRAHKVLPNDITKYLVIKKQRSKSSVENDVVTLHQASLTESSIKDTLRHLACIVVEMITLNPVLQSPLLSGNTMDTLSDAILPPVDQLKCSGEMLALLKLMLDNQEDATIFRQIHSIKELLTLASGGKTVSSPKNGVEHNTAIKEKLTAERLAVNKPPSDLAAMEILADSCLECSVPKEATRFLKKAIVEIQTSFGKTGSEADLLRIQIKYGKVLQLLDLHGEALASYQAALESALKVDDKGKQAVILIELGKIFSGQGDAARGEDCFQKAIALDVGCHGEITTVALIAYGKFLHRRKDYKKAIQMFTKVLERLTAVRTAATLPKIGEVSLMLAHLHYVCEETKEATIHLRAALENHMRVNGDQYNETTIEMVETLIELYLKAKDEGKAVEMCADYVKVLSSVFGTSSHEYARGHMKIGEAFARLGKVERGVAFMDKALWLYEELQHVHAETIIEDMAELKYVYAGMMAKLEKYGEAVVFYQEAKAIHEELFGVKGDFVEKINEKITELEGKKTAIVSTASLVDQEDEAGSPTETACDPEAAIMAVMEKQIKEVGVTEAFFVGDMGNVVRQHQKWVRLLPRAKPFYAIKSCPDPMVLQTLIGLGTGFDCASKGEIKRMLDMGVPPNLIIFANPCKDETHIQFAVSSGVLKMTFDNEDEMRKIIAVSPKVELIIRILPDDSKSICKLGTKFGASMENTKEILRVAAELKVNVIGVSFHVGSGCMDATSFLDAVQLARATFDFAETVGYNFTLLDIGGGFPGTDSAQVSFENVAQLIAPAIDELFPPNVQVIAEPGRYYSANAFSLAVRIGSKRAVKPTNEENPQKEPTSFMYYVNDGVYSSFNCLLFDHAVLKTPQIVSKRELDEEAKVYPSSIWGPTCDSMDCISQCTFLPELFIGEWLVYAEMGSYTFCAASEFNGFTVPKLHYINTEKTQQ